MTGPVSIHHPSHRILNVRCSSYHLSYRLSMNIFLDNLGTFYKADGQSHMIKVGWFTIHTIPYRVKG